MSYHFHYEQKPWNQTENLRISIHSPNGYALVQPLVFRQYQPVEIGDDIALSSGYASNNVRDFLQAALDEAWKIGLRPSQYEDQRNELKAVREHLADMRAISFKKIGMDDPLISNPTLQARHSPTP